MLNLVSSEMADSGLSHAGSSTQCAKNFQMC